ncbi:MAG: winged helix-turn-helix transcriptional regulator [Acidimicrobiales bacterium]
MRPAPAAGRPVAAPASTTVPSVARSGPACGTGRGLDAALAAVGERWSLLIVAALLAAARPLRFGELQESVPGIATNVLTQRLRHLESVQVLVARPYSQRPVRAAYELTAAGRELGDVLVLLARWGATRAGAGARGDAAGEGALVHEACGTPLEARWWCPTCDRVVDDPAEGPLGWA